MRRAISIGSLLLLAAASLSAQTSAPTSIPNGLPSWAYNIPDKVQPPTKAPTGPIRVPGSTKEYSPAEVASGSDPPDWFPGEHGLAPRVVKDETGATKNACGTCHLMSGQGHPESADIAGLPPAYIVRQMECFKSGARKEENRMEPIARATSDEDVRAAAAYFSAIKPIVWVQVIETPIPPKTYIATSGRHRVLSPEGGTEPIGHRIIEVPKDPGLTEDRDPHSSFVAYVPPGSIAKGAELAKNGQCESCHGKGLRGLGDVPRLAGLQPVYIARQLICIQNGTSNGVTVAPMKKVVANLSEDDIIAISAYLGSLPPR